MCGRFVLATPVAELGRLFDVADRPNLAARWNIAPTQQIAVIRMRSAEDRPPARQLVTMRWGLVPFWAKDLDIGAKMINARSETLAEKPAFREALRRRRAIVLADGFYEWTIVKGKKQPLFIRPGDTTRNGGILAFAGLWESWSGPKGEPPLPEPLLTATIVTTAANATLRPIHDRMPVILERDDWALWLDPATSPERALSLLKPADDGLLEAIPVGARVGNVRNDDAACVAPLAETPSLF